VKARRSAINTQISSTTPKGQAPARNPKTLDNAQPSAKASTDSRWAPLERVHHHHETKGACTEKREHAASLTEPDEPPV
jgi:hypothetical protein